MATACADRWLREGGELPHQICKGVASGLGFLDDYAYFANGLLDLFDATEDRRWAEAAGRVVDAMCSMFRDGSDGSFFYTSERHEQLFGRTKPAMDSAMPSAVAEAARALFRLGRTDEARRTLVASLGWMQRMPRSTMSLLALALDDLLESPEAPREADVSSHGVTVRLEPREITVDDEGWAHAEVVILIPEGLHINSNDPTAKWLTATTVRVEGVLGEAGFPEPENEIYTGETRIGLRLRPKGGTEEFELTVRYQACTESDCHLPQEEKLAGVVIVP